MPKWIVRLVTFLVTHPEVIEAVAAGVKAVKGGDEQPPDR